MITTLIYVFQPPCCDDVLIPIKMDNFALDGVREVRDQVVELAEFNERVRIRGCFITMYQHNGVNIFSHVND